MRKYLRRLPVASSLTKSECGSRASICAFVGKKKQDSVFNYFTG